MNSHTFSLWLFQEDLDDIDMLRAREGVTTNTYT